MQTRRRDPAHGPVEMGTGASVAMLALMLAMCVATFIVFAVASAVGGPAAWIVGGAVLVALFFAHLKLMRHGGH